MVRASSRAGQLSRTLVLSCLIWLPSHPELTSTPVRALLVCSQLPEGLLLCLPSLLLGLCKVLINVCVMEVGVLEQLELLEHSIPRLHSPTVHHHSTCLSPVLCNDCCIGLRAIVGD